MSVVSFLPALGAFQPRSDFASLAEARYAARAVIGAAERRLAILYAPADSQLYLDTAVLAALKRFILSPHYTRVRLLRLGTAHDDDPLQTLTQQLSTSFEVRELPATVRAPGSSCLVADATATVLRPSAAHWHGAYSIDNPAAARTHLSHFESLWSLAPASQPYAVAL